MQIVYKVLVGCFFSPHLPLITVLINNSFFSLLFWTDDARNSPSVKKAHMDGTSVSKIITTGIIWPNGLAIDYKGEHENYCGFINIRGSLIFVFLWLGYPRN